MEDLFARIRRMGFIVLVGVCVIIYIALGIVYFQQGPKQKNLEEQIRKASIVVSKPLPSADKLQTEYEEVNEALSPIMVSEVLEIIVGIARENGIDVDPAAGKFNIPAPALPVKKKIGLHNYQVLSLTNIMVRGDPDSVMAFISDLDLGKTLKTMVLKKLEVSQTILEVKAEERTRREEFRAVSLAVLAMMSDNGLSEIPAPLDYAGGVATNDMGATSATGFPDNTTSASDKGYTGSENTSSDTPRDGYVLYEHDKISADDTTQFETVSYIPMSNTEYYYTVEADGTVRQFNDPDVEMAIEYPDIETVATLDVYIYFKPLEGDSK